MPGTHARFMRTAIELADRGWGRVHPNPLVGAVIVREGDIVATGWHQVYGGAHAEIDALAAAGEAARGATLYVTLEPCSHHGKTPPCTDAIIRAGIATVVFGAEDPHPEAGGGAEVLRRAGINVVSGVEREAVRHQNAMFFHAVESNSPFVALKLAMSLDARIAEASGQRTRITADEAAAEVHRLRSGFDAILIGSNTAQVDDPMLTVRNAAPPIRPPVRVVLDTNAQLPTGSALLHSADAAPLWLFVSADAEVERVKALEAAGAKVFAPDLYEGRVPLRRVLETLWDNGIRSVFCEGGGTLATALLSKDLVERVYLFVAPRLLGPAGVPAFPFESSPKSLRFRTTRIAQLGNDALLMLDRERVSGSAGERENGS